MERNRNITLVRFRNGGNWHSPWVHSLFVTGISPMTTVLNKTNNNRHLSAKQTCTSASLWVKEVMPQSSEKVIWKWRERKKLGLK